MPFLACGTQKPPRGARVNDAHPFARGLLVTVLFNEGMGTPSLIPMGAFTGKTPTVVGTPVWASNSGGPALKFAAMTDALRLPASNAAGTSGPTGTTAATICFVRRKVDTTLRSGWTFGYTGGSSGDLCRAAAIYGDGTVYFDFGGTSAPNRLTVAGLSVAATVEAWVFTAGKQGSAIWRNGLKVASQATAVSTIANTSNLSLNGLDGTNGDIQELNYFASYNTQWADDLCRWWSAEPYAHLYPQTAQRRYFLLGNLAAAAAGHPARRRVGGIHHAPGRHGLSGVRSF